MKPEFLKRTRQTENKMDQQYPNSTFRQQTWGTQTGKRPRPLHPPATSNEPRDVDDWHHSFKRMKVMDDTSGTSMPVATHSPLHDDSFHSGGMTPQLQEEHYGSYQHHHQQQSTGQKSGEPQAPGYQPVNSMLGELHRMRLQRASGSQHPQQPPQEQQRIPQQPQLTTHQPLRSPDFMQHKKPVSLRTSSKLY